MRRWIAIGLGAVVGGAIAGGLLLERGYLPWSGGQGAARAAPAAPRRWPAEVRRASPEVSARVGELLRDGSHRAWERLAVLYPDADRATKRRIVEHATRAPLRQALGHVLMTVGDDPTPVEDDPLVEDAAELLKVRWTKPDELNFGRELMLMQSDDKRRWVLARAMTSFAGKLPPESAFASQKARLLVSLVDLHASTSDPFIRGEIVNSVKQLGANDVALLLAGGPNVAPDRLEVVRKENAAQAAAMESFKLHGAE